MIISASRRTDIPAFYADWLLNRVRAGFCTVPNPFNAGTLSLVSLRPRDVDCFVFWTRNARPLLRHLPELDDRGLRYYFQYTLVGYPRAIDPHSPGLDAALATFRATSARVGPGRVIWRYDPITLSELTPPDFHRGRFAQIARGLAGATTRCVISLLDPYRKTARRCAALAARGIHLTHRAEMPADVIAALLHDLADIAARCGMEIVSCAEEPELTAWGVRPGRCIDGDILRREWGLVVPPGQNTAPRPGCGCIESRDIGMYESCLFGCAYCYATASFDRARANYAAHDPRAPSLLGWHAPPAPWFDLPTGAG